MDSFGKIGTLTHIVGSLKNLCLASTANLIVDLPEPRIEKYGSPCIVKYRFLPYAFVYTRWSDGKMYRTISRSYGINGILDTETRIVNGQYELIRSWYPDGTRRSEELKELSGDWAPEYHLAPRIICIYEGSVLYSIKWCTSGKIINFTQFRKNLTIYHTWNNLSTHMWRDGTMHRDEENSKQKTYKTTAYDIDGYRRTIFEWLQGNRNYRLTEIYDPDGKLIGTRTVETL